MIDMLKIALAVRAVGGELSDAAMEAIKRIKKQRQVQRYGEEAVEKVQSTGVASAIRSQKNLAALGSKHPEIAEKTQKAISRMEGEKRKRLERTLRAAAAFGQ